MLIWMKVTATSRFNNSIDYLVDWYNWAGMIKRRITFICVLASIKISEQTKIFAVNIYFKSKIIGIHSILLAFAHRSCGDHC